MSSTTGITNTYTNPAYNMADKSASSSLDKNGFLKMLTEQMREPGPDVRPGPQPVLPDDLADDERRAADQPGRRSTTAALSRQKDANATQLIGKTVTYPGSDGLPVTGLVESVQLSAKDGPSLTVAGVAGVHPDLVTNVQ